MSHELTQRADGTTEFASVVRSVEERPWHGLGQFVDKPMTTKEAIVTAKMDWTVRKTPKVVGETGFVIPDDFAILRNDTNEYLGGVRSGYEIVQNVDVFNFFDGLLDIPGGPIIETAGSLFGGKRIFVTAKLPSVLKVSNGEKKKFDEIEKYIFLSSSHDASGAITCAFTPIRIVCNNTLQFALKNMENVIRIKHTRKVQERLAMASEIMKMVDGVSEELQVVFNEMAKTKITDQKALEYIACVMSSQDKMVSKEDFEQFYSVKNLNLAQKIFEYYQESPTQQYACTKGKVYGVYQAITGYYQNIKEYGSKEEKFDDLVLVSNSTPQKKMIKAFDTAVSLMN